MKVSNLLAAAGAVFVLTAGAALAAEGCECCKDMAAGSEMSCCDKMKSDETPVAPPVDAPEPTPEAPQPAQPQ